MTTARILSIVTFGIVLYFAVGGALHSFLFERQQHSFMGGALLAQALSDVKQVKVATDRYYTEFGRLPRDNRALGFGAPHTFARNAVRSLDVRDGSIVVTFNGELSEGATLVMRATPSTSGVGRPIDWRCESATLSATLLATAAPRCAAVDQIAMVEQPPRTPAPDVSTEDLINAMQLRRRPRTLEIIRAGVNVNAEHLGTFPLQLAIEQGDARVVEALLKAGADANARLAKMDGMSMLMYAAAGARRNSSIVRALIRADGELDGRDAKGRTPLMHAARKASTAALDLLLRAGAKPDAVDHAGNTPLAYAARHGRGSGVYRRLINIKHKNNEIVVIIPDRD